MAKQVTVTLVDDLDGAPAEETVRFGLDGVDYEIDLGAKNAAKLRSALGPYVTAGHRTGGRRVRGSKAVTVEVAPAGPTRSAQVRAWAAKNDVAVSAKGRIPKAVIEQFDAATAAAR